MRIYLTVISIISCIEVAHCACDLSGTAWPSVVWRDIMRGTAVQVCDRRKVGDGRCDNSNNMLTSNCEMDGGDCCLTTCIENCVGKLSTSVTSGSDIPYPSPSGLANQCAYMCGVSESYNCPYMCLSDQYMSSGSRFSSWCSSDRGVRTPMSSCYSTTGQVVSALLECLKDDASHGNLQTASSRCGNQTGDCSVSNVLEQIDGCHLHPDHCTKGSCCSEAISRGWIDPSVTVLPDACSLFSRCIADPDCFPTMALCARTNKACRGGCCMCTNNEWYGSNCDRPLCWPKCKHGQCMAPNTCHCESGWSGESCEIPVCDPPCGQGACIAPNVCECFYGWTGIQCETPKSTPPCINGRAVAPDTCQCDAGWGGRICDYPLCQSYPDPSADCGEGVCEAPWTCKCDPGFTTNIPAGADGISIPPLFWKGRDLTGKVTPLVPGDSRFVTSGTSLIFDQYNAFKCEAASDCRLSADSRCAECTGRTCTRCESGYYVSSTGRCWRCALQFPSCRSCDSTQCLTCDPLFVLLNGECVSDGIVELTSTKYNVKDTDEFVEIVVVRSAVRSPPNNVLTVTVDTTELMEGSAVSRSVRAMSDFESSKKTVSISGNGIEKIRILIFDNLRIDNEIRAFRVNLIPSVGTIAGSPVSIVPDLHAGAVESGPVLTAEVFIWDTRTFDYTLCQVGSGISVTLSLFNVPMVCAGLDEEVLFVTITTLSSGAELKPLITALNGSPGTVQARAPATSEQSFSVLVQHILHGVFVKHYLLTNKPVAGQAADISRLERTLNQTWEATQDAPALALYSGFIDPNCFANHLPVEIALSVSQGGKGSLTVDGVTVLSKQREVNLQASDEQWLPPVSGICDTDIFCYSATIWTDLVRIEVSFIPSRLFLTRPAGVRLLALNQNQEWEVVPKMCLFGGIEIQGSPVRGLVT